MTKKLAGRPIAAAALIVVLTVIWFLYPAPVVEISPRISGPVTYTLRTRGEMRRMIGKNLSRPVAMACDFEIEFRPDGTGRMQPVGRATDEIPAGLNVPLRGMNFATVPGTYTLLATDEARAISQHRLLFELLFGGRRGPTKIGDELEKPVAMQAAPPAPALSGIFVEKFGGSSSCVEIASRFELANKKEFAAASGRGVRGYDPASGLYLYAEYAGRVRIMGMTVDYTLRLDRKTNE